MSLNDQVTTDDLRQLEVRLDARVDAVSARLISLEGRVTAIDQQTRAFARRAETRFRSIDQRLDATRTNIDHLRLLLEARIDRARANLARVVMLGLVGTTVAIAALCLATIVLLL